MSFGQSEPPVVIEFPLRFGPIPNVNRPRDEVLEDLWALAEVFVKGSEAVVGLYQRIVDYIRAYSLSPFEARPVLERAGFPSSRISEMLRLAYTDEAIYREYASGKLSFRVALRKTRMYYQTMRTTPLYRKRHARRIARTLVNAVQRLGENEMNIQLKHWEVLVRRRTEYNKQGSLIELRRSNSETEGGKS